MYTKPLPERKTLHRYLRVSNHFLAYFPCDIYRFVTMVYYYNYQNSGYYSSSCLI
jgi:hypothetical protein